jgi:hypothetical protein
LVFLAVPPLGVRLSDDTPWHVLLILWSLASSPLAIVLVVAAAFYLKSTAALHGAGSSVRTPLLSVLFGVVWSLAGVLLIAPLATRDGPVIGVATLGLLLGTKLLLDLATSRSRPTWPSICASLGVFAGALGLHVGPTDFVGYQAMDPTEAWAETNAPSLELAARYFLWCVPLGTIAALVLVRLPMVRRALRHVPTGVGTAAAATLFVLLILATGRAGPSRAPGSRMVDVPVAWGNLGVTVLALVAALLLMRVALAQSTARRAASSATPYRDPAAQSEPDSESVDTAAEATELAGLRWEVPVVAIVCFGLAPLLNAARESTLPSRATASANHGGGDGPGECEERSSSTDEAYSICDETCVALQIEQLPPALSVAECDFDHAAAGVVGFSFMVGAKPLVVSALGFYDEGADGLGEAHQVGIFDLETEKLVVSATVPAGTIASESGGFRYVCTPPATLSGDKVYAVLAHRTTNVDGIGFSCQKVEEAPFLDLHRTLGAQGAEGLVFTNKTRTYSSAWLGPSSGRPSKGLQRFLAP